MSATRIVRNQFTNKRHVTYHERCIENGERHISFQRRIRAARYAIGYRATSSDMHHFEGHSY
jgi:methionine-rich copper-binding protein CopC